MASYQLSTFNYRQLIMAEITAATVGKLREMTNAGMMDCKKALTEANGDVNAAVDILRKISTAFSMSPPASVSAFLQSIMPALVISRSLPTFAAVISAIINL